MNKFTLFCLVGCFSLSCVGAQKVQTSTSGPEINILDEILRQITQGILNSRNNGANGQYEVADDGSIRFIPVSPSALSATPTTTTESTTTAEPNLSDDESVKDYVAGEEDAEGSLWEFVSQRGEDQDPLGQEAEEFPLVETNEIEYNDKREKPTKLDTLVRRRRDVNVDVGGSGSSGAGSGGVNVDVNKPGSNVAVNVGNIQDFLSAFGIHFNAKPSGGHGSSHYGSSSNSVGAVDVNVNKPGNNVDVNVGGKPGAGNGVDVSVNKPNKNTNVVVDWASFIPFVNVGVNKNKGGSGNVDVNVGGNSHSSGGLVDVKVNKDDVEAGTSGSKHRKVVVRAPFVDLDIDGDVPPPRHPHDEDEPRPHKKHRKYHRRHHEEKDVSVNVGGHGPFVDVKVGNDGTPPQGKAVGRKCVKINVPFVNVLVNRGCDPES